MANKTITFSGKGKSGDLLGPNNWIGGVIPGLDNDNAIITMNVGGPVGGTFSVNNMELLGHETITFTGTLNTPGQNDAAGDTNGFMVCKGAEAIFAPGSTLNNGDVLMVGDGGPGTLLAEGSGTVQSVINSAHAYLGMQAAGVGNVTIDDAIWNNAGNFNIGMAGAASVNVVDGGSVVVDGGVACGGIDMGGSIGSSGVLNIASGSSVVSVGEIRVGVGGVVQTDAGIGSVNVGSGSRLTSDQTIAVGNGSQIDLAGGTVTGGSEGGFLWTLAGGVIAGNGMLATPDGQAIVDNGLIQASGGTLTVQGNITGVGSMQIDANSTAVLTGSSLHMASIAFIGADATLSLAHGSNVGAAISGFAIGDMIATTNINLVSFNPTNSMLALDENGARVDTLHLVGSFAGDVFALTQSGANSIITLEHT